MYVYIKNKSLETVGIIDVYTSLIWTKRYYTAGDFELYLPPTAENLELLQVGNYLIRDDDDSVMIIEAINITTDSENGNFLTVTGRSIESVLARRVIWQQTTLNTDIESAVYALITQNAISPALTERKIDRLTLAEKQGYTERVQAQYTGDNLYTVISDLCRAHGCGWKITLQDGRFVFQIYKGVDRSYNQSDIPFVVFSPEFDNLISSEYAFDTTTFANAALIGGEGEGTERKFETVGTAAGLDRYEIFVDARDVSSNSDSENPLTDAQYSELLKTRGVEKVAENVAAETFEGEAETTTYEYKTAWNIGDIVQVENEYGMQAAPRIIEVIESMDSSGHKIIPTWEVE